MKELTPKELADGLFDLLMGRTLPIRLIYDGMFGPSPWLGWAPMLCEICRRVQKAEAERINGGGSDAKA